MSTQRDNKTNNINFQNKNYNIFIRQEKEQLILSAKNRNNSEIYTNKYSLTDLTTASKFFRINDNVSESFKEIEKLINEKKISIKEENDSVILNFIINLATIPKFSLKCEKEKNDFLLDLITEEEKKLLQEFIGKDKKVKLLYKASKDGDKADNFYAKCENKGPTLTLILTTNQRKFGGYTSLSWKRPVNDDPVYYKDENAFIFCLNKKKKYCLRNEQDRREKAICMYKNNGPAFGGGNDFVVFNECCKNSNSYSNCPYSYKTVRNELNGGNYNFQVKDYEVYSVF